MLFRSKPPWLAPGTAGLGIFQPELTCCASGDAEALCGSEENPGSLSAALEPRPWEMEGWAHPLPAGKARSRCLEQVPSPVGTCHFPSWGSWLLAGGGARPEPGDHIQASVGSPQRLAQRGQGRAGWSTLRSCGPRLWALGSAEGPRAGWGRAAGGTVCFASLKQTVSIWLRLPRCFQLAFLFDLRLKHFSWWQRWLRALCPSQDQRNVQENSGVLAPSLAKQAACDP